VDALVEVRALLPDDLDLGDLDGQLVERLASMVSGLPTQALAQYQEAKRVGLFLLWLWRLRTQLIDTALTVSNELIAGALRRAKNAAAKEQQKQNKRAPPLLTICVLSVSWRVLGPEKITVSRLRCHRRHHPPSLNTLWDMES